MIALGGLHFALRTLFSYVKETDLLLSQLE